MGYKVDEIKTLGSWLIDVLSNDIYFYKIATKVAFGNKDLTQNDNDQTFNLVKKQMKIIKDQFLKVKSDIDDGAELIGSQGMLSYLKMDPVVAAKMGVSFESDIDDDIDPEVIPDDVLEDVKQLAMFGRELILFTSYTNTDMAPMSISESHILAVATYESMYNLDVNILESDDEIIGLVAGLISEIKELGLDRDTKSYLSEAAISYYQSFDDTHPNGDMMLSAKLDELMMNAKAESVNVI